MKVWAAIHQGPSASGRERHFAPLSWRQMIALIVRRRCRGGTLAAGRQASISGASTSHCSSVRPIAPSSKPEERPPRPCVQALTGPSRLRAAYVDRRSAPVGQRHARKRHLQRVCSSARLLGNVLLLIIYFSSG